MRYREIVFIKGYIEIPQYFEGEHDVELRKEMVAYKPRLF